MAFFSTILSNDFYRYIYIHIYDFSPVEKNRCTLTVKSPVPFCFFLSDLSVCVEKRHRSCCKIVFTDKVRSGAVVV